MYHHLFVCVIDWKPENECYWTVSVTCFRFCMKDNKCSNSAVFMAFLSSDWPQKLSDKLKCANLPRIFSSHSTNSRMKSVLFHIERVDQYGILTFVRFSDHPVYHYHFKFLNIAGRKRDVIHRQQSQLHLLIVVGRDIVCIRWSVAGHRWQWLQFTQSHS